MTKPRFGTNNNYTAIQSIRKMREILSDENWEKIKHSPEKRAEAKQQLTECGFNEVHEWLDQTINPR
jgi:hypothetical protein